MTTLNLLLNDLFELSKSYTPPASDRTVDHISVQVPEGSSLSTNISTYTFSLIITLPSGQAFVYTLTPSTATAFEQLNIPVDFSVGGATIQILVTGESDTEIGESNKISLLPQHYQVKPDTLTIVENGTYDVSEFDKVIVDAGSSSTFDLEKFFDRTLTELELDVPAIGDYMFYKNETLQSFSDTQLESLGKYAFYECTALTSFTAPDDLDEIKEYTFYNCKAIEDIGTLKASKIGNYACYYLSANVADAKAFKYSPTNPAEIGNYGFQYAKISEVSGEIKKIGDYGLANLPSTFTKFSAKIDGTVGSYGLANNQYVKTVDFSESSIKTLGTYAFYYFGYNRANYSTDPHMALDFRNSSFGKVEQYCFGYNRYVDIYLPKQVSQIDNYAFYACQYFNLFMQGKAPTLSSTNAFNSAGNYKIYAPWKYLNSYVTGTNWASLSSYIIGYSEAGTFTAGDTLPEYNAEGYALTWYSDEQKTTEITTCPEDSPMLYCSVSATKEKQVVIFATSGPINITVTDSSSNPVDISLGYLLAENGDTFSVNASSPEQGYTYYIKVDGTKVTSFPYALTVSTDDISISGTAYDPTAVNPDFNEATWRELKTAVETGVAATLYADNVGSTKEVTLKNGQTVHLRLSNNTADLYNLAEGSGTTGFVFEFVECLNQTYQMNTTNTNEGGWNASYLRTTTMPLILALLPDEIQEVIATVKRKSCYSGNDGTIVESSDNLFVPLDPEVFGTSGYSRTEEKSANTRWQYYADNDTASARIKTVNGSASYWWLGSPYNGNTSYFCIVYTNGYANYNGAYSSRGVAPSFCL